MRYFHYEKEPVARGAEVARAPTKRLRKDSWKALRRKNGGGRGQAAWSGTSGVPTRNLRAKTKFVENKQDKNNNFNPPKRVYNKINNIYGETKFNCVKFRIQELVLDATVAHVKDYLIS